MKKKFLVFMVAAVLLIPLTLVAGTKGKDEGGEAAAEAPTGTTDPLQFYAWIFMPDKINEYNEYFEEHWNEQTETHILPNLGYVPAMQVKIMGGVRMDVMYNFSWNQLRWINVGWAAELTDKPGVNEIMDDIIDAAKPLYVTDDGRIVSLPYFLAPFVTMYNKELLSKAGYDHFPKTKEEMYEMSVALKEMGVKNPYIAYWNQDFVDRYFFIYLLSEGIQIFDDNYDPTFQNDPDTKRVFDWWVSMYQDGLTSPTIMTDFISDFSIMMQEGQAAFYNLHHYFLKGLVEADAKESANITFGPWEPGKTGTGLLIGEVLQLGGNSPDQDRAWELLKFYSWKNKEGEYHVPKTWAIEAGLLEPYKGFYKDQEIVDSFKNWIDWDQLMDIVNNKSEVMKVRQQIWYPEFRTEAAPLLHKMILGEVSTDDAIEQIADIARNAKAATQ
ncbi:MAG TPA: carbohydrate ABC transporter substrate-binding protein [Spirochaetes bacterium]|nr:carbohydrate ABC transporter substrate-binding protein [Spirochaetota bacterium]